MKAELRFREHSETPGARVIEVFYGGELVCAIYGADGPGVRIVSKYARPDNVHTILEPAQGPIPGVVEVMFKEC